MNFDRLVRDVEDRLALLDPAARAEVLDVLREAIARERRWLDPSLTVEAERERRVLAEELREALEAIHRPARLDEAIDEVLKQLQRAVVLDFSAVAVAEPGLGFRVLAIRGADAPGLVGASISDPFLDEIREARQPAGIADAEAASRPLPLPGAPALRSWAVLPLLVEGDAVGLLFAGRLALDPLTDDELHRAKAIAFAAAAALRTGQMLAQVRRYATLLEEVVTVDERAFRGETPEKLAQAILDGACRLGGYRGGMLIQQSSHGPVVAATHSEAFTPTLGRSAPPDLVATASRRLPTARILEIAESIGTPLPAEQLYLVPLVAGAAVLGCLALLDPGGESADDRLVESYASRAAMAWRHAAVPHAQG